MKNSYITLKATLTINEAYHKNVKICTKQLTDNKLLLFSTLDKRPANCMGIVKSLTLSNSNMVAKIKLIKEKWLTCLTQQEVTKSFAFLVSFDDDTVPKTAKDFRYIKALILTLPDYTLIG